MKKIGLLSDTHGYLDERIFKHFAQCDEIWHAGDIGCLDVYECLNSFKPTRAVYGNIDGQAVRAVAPQHQRFMCEKVDVWITHIGGYPNRYSPNVKPNIFINPPTLFISGHSHILKVMYDKNLQLLHINPGAAGLEGFHQVRTLVRFNITENRIEDLEIIELNDR